ncbi:uncharacterized protein BO95DRAFT_442591 [Aspergillus brunneoviolaceus CBS 621.78]|uniref:Uncharacterized protein n=1 Tax=Aspergillus brunneoviolaceus CBS 621.78 TaxID=1450534 RepID=A0ACD1G9J8_9EURO|nr:hypothetical protein BO95DRAFT_442591 [Aspergillus brunneoviolaceus CBS 621.78]RAH45924.1 hypothetical protein BO95DRAFT_442591 [Aspergillus brunneoviolaceus CBS 621.78]
MIPWDASPALTQRLLDGGAAPPPSDVGSGPWSSGLLFILRFPVFLTVLLISSFVFPHINHRITLHLFPRLRTSRLPLRSNLSPSTLPTSDLTLRAIMTDFKFANSSEKVPGDGNLPAEFSIKASPSTDIWAKPPSTESFNAPILYRSVPVQSFKRARVAFNALWKHKYDQGGVILVLNGADGTRKWVKSGIELANGRPHLSTVAKDRWADWSLQPVPSGGGAATLEIVRESDNSLWIYLVEGVQKSPLREVTWFFEDTKVQDLWIGLYAAKPSDEKEDLVVNFGHLIIDSAE